MSKQHTKRTTLTNGQIFGAANALALLAQTSLPIPAAFRLSQNLKRLQGHVAEYEEFRQGIFKEHGQTGADGTLVVKDDHYVFASEEDEAEALRKVGELAGLEVDVEYTPVKLSELTAGRIQPAALLPLEFMIVDDLE